jgi:hypothetical protein
MLDMLDMLDVRRNDMIVNLEMGSRVGQPDQGIPRWAA